MASSYSTDLKLELMVTGEKAGQWGDITNTNLNLVQQAVAGYEAIDVASSDVALTMSNAAISNARNATIKLTGTLAANRNVTVPDSIEKVYNVIDGTDHAGYTLTFKTASGSGVLLCEGNCYVLYADGTNVVKANEYRKWRTVSAAETVQAGAKLFVETNGGAVTITLPASPAVGDEVHFVDSRYTFDSNALTVGRNSSKIANASSDLVVNTEGAAFGLVYSGSNVGWTYTEK
mgnify:FL=1|jgi:hypothetical protein|tara:strand:+ start:2195 stop:2893 length:699 start_codon:yes stop_codon:yes gene_type:complete